MRVAFLYNEASEDPAGIAEDSDPAQSPVVASLRALGHDVCSLACTLDLESVRSRLERLRPDAVFNRVESLGGSDALVVSLLALLDTLQLPYTGCPTAPYLATTNKLTVKRRLAAAGMPTPKWVGQDCGLPATAGKLLADCELNFRADNPKFILKSVLEHASFAIDDNSIVSAVDREQLLELIEEREARFGRPYFAEEYIDGREFNLAVWGGNEPEVLPPAEIDFSAFPAGKPRIVSHQAKFNEESFEYENTPRRYDFPPADRMMIERLQELAVACWRLFDFAGYVRVDFRCDAQGQPWILEINANPCISPGSGFAAAMDKAKISYERGIEKILLDAVERHGRAAIYRHTNRMPTHDHAITL